MKVRTAVNGDGRRKFLLRSLVTLGGVIVAGASDIREPKPGILLAQAASQHSGTTRIGTNQVRITVSGGQRVISANGVPDHQPGQFPNNGNPNPISAQVYNFHLPVDPQAAAQPRTANGAWFGVALNGVPFEPGTAEFWNDQREWNYEAKSGFINLGLDEHNAHVQSTGAYHYHGLPIGLIQHLGGDSTRMLLVGYAADGFPIYTARGYSTANDTKSPLKTLHSSYRLKVGERLGGPGGKFDGKFTTDFEYVKGSGDLDECNGRYGVTPEFPQGTYHYYLTVEFPWMSRFWKGTPDSTFQKRDPGPGGVGPGGPRPGRHPHPPGAPNGGSPRSPGSAGMPLETSPSARGIA